MKNNKRVINAYEIYYRLSGVKKSRLLNTKAEVNTYRRKLKREKRKFLGDRRVSLIEA